MPVLAAAAPSGPLIAIDTDHTTLRLTVGNDGRLYQTYFGNRLANPANYALLPAGRHEAYVPAGLDNLVALRAEPRGAGVREPGANPGRGLRLQPAPALRRAVRAGAPAGPPARPGATGCGKSTSCPAPGPAFPKTARFTPATTCRKWADWRRLAGPRGTAQNADSRMAAQISAGAFS